MQKPKRKKIYKYFINDEEFSKEDFFIYLYNYINEYNIFKYINEYSIIDYGKIAMNFKKKRYHYYKINDKEFMKIYE